MRLMGVLAGGAAFAALAISPAAAQAPPAVEPTEAPIQTVEMPVAAEEEAPEIAPPPAAPTFTDALAAGKLIFEERVRYEGVDQTGLALRATSVTARTKIGWETADFHGWRALIEVEDTRQIGPEKFNVAVPGVAGGSLNGKTQYPIINDPDVTEINRAQLTWAPTGWAGFTFGRQRIALEDQRFIGTLVWRQDEMTFDAIRTDLSYGKWRAFYAYVGHVNRSLGQERDWDSDSHLATLTYTHSEPIRLHGFYYAMDFDNAKANNNLTYGGKFSGKTWVNQFQLAYNATYAHQTDYRRETPAYALDYYSADLTATYDIYSVKATYEVLEGNGTRGFITPLALTHAFNGWSDAFAAVSGNKTYVDGIEDKNIQVTLRPRKRWTYLFNIEALVRYHDFNADRTGVSIAHEWDAQLTAAVTNNLTIAAKYADFNRAATVPAGTAAPPASRSKLWFWFEYRF